MNQDKPKCATCPRTDIAGRFWLETPLCPGCWMEWEDSPEFKVIQARQPFATNKEFEDSMREWLERVQARAA